MRRRTGTPTSVSASPGLTTEHIYNFTTPAFLHLGVDILIIPDPPGAAGSDPKRETPLPFWQSRDIGSGVRTDVEDTSIAAG
jgi:hypothetical protein